MFALISYPIGEKETVPYKIEPKPKLIPKARISKGDINNTSMLEMSVHGGTHIDVPFHTDPNGLTIDKMDIQDFIFESPLLIECRKSDFETITREDLIPFCKDLEKADFLMIYSGFSEYRFTDSDRFINNSCGISKDGAEYLVNNFNLRGVMVDFLGVENINEGLEKGFKAHEVFLARGKKFIVVEDGNFKHILNKEIKRVFIIPLMLVGAEASPVTAFVEI
ncbi:MAG: cyclase family protein [Actinomycetota bacterium]|nr:cyclase family protein [Actinomycetota bacterium]